MDTFDDLLQSRRALEDNPFEDPFAKRSVSPDPWSTFSREPEYDTPTHSGSAFGDAAASTATHDVFGAVEHVEPSPSSPPMPATGPLDIAAANASDEEELPNKPFASTPGFRESIATPPAEERAATPKIDDHPALVLRDEPAPIVAAAARSSTPPTRPLPEELPVTPSTPSRLPTSPVTEYRPPRAATPPSPFASTLKPSSPIADRAIISPLEQTRRPMEHSFASLALGGESAGGWGGEASAFVNEQGLPPVSSGWRAPSEDDDDDDDRPLQDIVDKSRAADKSTANGDDEKGMETPTVSKDSSVRPLFVITVDDPQKVGDPIRGYTMYTVHTKTTSPLYASSSFSVLRRYSDFLWIYETLSMNNPGVVVPPVPEKSPFGRFEDQFVQQRRLGLEKCINKTANHPVLAKDADLRLFLESDSFALDIKHRKAEIAHERGGLIASLGQTIAGPRFHEMDEWFDRQKAYLDSLELQLRGLVKAIDLVAKQRSDLAIATGEFAQTIAELATSDVGPALAHALAGMADVERIAQDVQSAQSRRDTITVMATADEYARLINSVRLAFVSRVRTYNNWQNADAEVRRVKQLHEKNRAQGRIPADRLGFSLSQIAEAERRAIDSKQEFEHCSRLIKSELARFEQERIGDFKTALEAFLDGMVGGQKQLIAAWEGYQQVLLKRVTPAEPRSDTEDVTNGSDD